MKDDSDIQEAEDVISCSSSDDEEQGFGDEENLIKPSNSPVGNIYTPRFFSSAGGLLLPANSPFRYHSIFFCILTISSLAGLAILFSGLIPFDDEAEGAFDNNEDATAPGKING